MDSSSSSDQMEEQEGREKRVLKKKKRNREIEGKEPLKGDGQLKAKQRCSSEFVLRRLSFKEHPEGRRAREKREGGSRREGGSGDSRQSPASPVDARFFTNFERIFFAGHQR